MTYTSPSFEDFLEGEELSWKSSNNITIQLGQFPPMIEWSNIIKYIANRGRCEVVIDISTEGFLPGILLFSSCIMKGLIENHNFKQDDFIIKFGLPDIPINYKMYSDCKKIYEYLPNPVFHCVWEEQIANWHVERETIWTNTRTKKLLCLNSQPRLHRLAAISEIIDRKIWDRARLSFYCEPDDLNKFDCVENTFILPNMKPRTDNNIQGIKHLLPMTLSMANDHSNMHSLLNNDIELFEDSVFSLVCESVFHNNIDLINKYPKLYDVIWCLPCIYPTEKTFRAIRTKHPFIIASVPGFLEGLHQMGYKTFHPYIDETYDTIENEEDRILAVMDQVERLCNMNDKETTEWLNSIHDIVQYNYERLMSARQRISR